MVSYMAKNTSLGNFLILSILFKLLIISKAAMIFETVNRVEIFENIDFKGTSTIYSSNFHDCKNLDLGNEIGSEGSSAKLRNGGGCILVCAEQCSVLAPQNCLELNGSISSNAHYGNLNEKVQSIRKCLNSSSKRRLEMNEAIEDPYGSESH